MYRLKRYGVAICIALTALCLPLPASAIESFGVGARPANPRPDNPRTESIFVYEAKPDQVVQDAVRVINNTDKTKRISVTTVDGIVSSDGAFGCAQAVDDKKDVGAWLTLSKQEVTLPAGGTEVIPFTMKVPSKVDVGEHNGCIAVQDMSATQNAGNGIVLSFRSALRVAVTVPGDIVAKLEFVDLTLELKADKLVATPSLQNGGNVSLDAEIKMAAKGLFGAASTNGGQFPILAKSTGKFNFELERPFWGGWYTVSADADFKKLSEGEKAKVEHIDGPRKTIFIPPQPRALLVEIGVPALILAAVGFWLWRWFSRRQLMVKTKRYTVMQGEHIENIATSHGIRWQLLAKLNHLKPPYHLTPGQQLRIPRKTKR